MLIIVTKLLLVTSLCAIAQAQLWRADYFKDEVMRFSTVECWQSEPVAPKENGVTRIAFVGDSTTLGVGGERSMLNFTYDYHLQLDGSKAGYKGFPYLLSQLYKQHNKTEMFEVLNLASDNFTLLTGKGPAGKNYKDTCEYKQLIQSQPDVVIAMLGGQESLNIKEFTPEKFSQAYKAFIKETEGLPSNPMVFIIIPPYFSKQILDNKNQLLTIKKTFKLSELDGKDFNPEQLKNWTYKDFNMTDQIFRICQNASIPPEQLIDSRAYLTDRFIFGPSKNETYADLIHLNEKGNGELSQAIYMRLAFSQKFMLRHLDNQIKSMQPRNFMSMLHNTQSLLGEDHRPPIHKNPDMFNTLATVLIEPYRIAKKYQNCKEDMLHDVNFASFYHQTPAPKPNELRIAFAGDSVTQGYGGNVDQYKYSSWQQRFSSQPDGSLLYFNGWPKRMHQMMQKNLPFGDKISDFTFMTYALSMSQITIPGTYHHFQSDCNYNMLMESYPHVVVLAFGGMDNILANFTETRFIQKYMEIISNLTSMPTKPIIYLAQPVMECLDWRGSVGHHSHVKEDLKDFDPQDWIEDQPRDCVGENKKFTSQIIKKVAKQANIPDFRVIKFNEKFNSYPREKYYGKDRVHPNDAGFQLMAEMVNDAMTKDPEIIQRTKKLAEGNDEDYNNAIQISVSKLAPQKFISKKLSKLQEMF